MAETLGKLLVSHRMLLSQSICLCSYAHSWLRGDSLYCTWERKLQPSEALEVGRKDDCEVSGVSFAPFLSLTLISAVFFLFCFFFKHHPS